MCYLSLKEHSDLQLFAPARTLLSLSVVAITLGHSGPSPSMRTANSHGPAVGKKNVTRVLSQRAVPCVLTTLFRLLEEHRWAIDRGGLGETACSTSLRPSRGPLDHVPWESRSGPH
jgi:hypothetical protein